MSRAYRVRVSESLERVVALDDGCASPLEILPILSRDRMAELLAEGLEERGFSPVEGKEAVLERRAAPGIVLRVDLDRGQIEARAEDEARIELEKSVWVSVEDGQPVEPSLGPSLQAALEEEASRQTEVARQGLTKRLEQAIEQVRPAVDKAVQEATRRALETRARELGEIQSIDENPETGSMVIRVKV